MKQECNTLNQKVTKYIKSKVTKWFVGTCICTYLLSPLWIGA